MRMSCLISRTLREPPSEAESANHQLLLRAGFIRQLAAGIFSYLPLAHSSMTRIENILREEMDALGGQEMTMPVVHPADLWKETGRWYAIGAEMGRFKDRAERDMVLAMTHEEVVASLVGSEIRSYRQLPALVYHIQTKWRDDPRPRGGLVRVREFTMLDSYSLDADWEGLDQQYQAHYRAYFRIFQRCALPVVAVSSDTGMMGGSLAHEFMYLSPIGEDSLLFCDQCGYSANRQIASLAKPTPTAEEAAALEKVATPDTTSIEALAKLLDIPAARTAKAVFMVATLSDGTDEKQEFVFAVVRGDMEVNETKLMNVLGALDLRPAQEEEIRAVGAVPGYASPIGLRNVRVVVDDLIPQSPNLVAGANEAGYHLRNVNYGRDYQAEIVADIVAAEEGSPCPVCSTPMRSSRGVEVGNIFKLGTRFTQAMGSTFIDEDGQNHPVIMGSYGIGVGRLLACVAEEHHDERGLVWPVTIAPYDVHLIKLANKDGTAEQKAEELYQSLCEGGFQVLYDNRDESAGVKFMDADLIGLPLRLTVSDRSLKQGGVEFVRRATGERFVVPHEEVHGRARGELDAMYAEIEGGR